MMTAEETRDAPAVGEPVRGRRLAAFFSREVLGAVTAILTVALLIVLSVQAVRLSGIWQPS